MAKCTGITRDGERCRGIAIDGSDYCYAHDPARAEERRRAAAKGGKRGGRGRPSVELARLQARFEDLAEQVLSGEIEPALAGKAEARQEHGQPSEAPESLGRPSIIDLASDAARRQLALEKQAFSRARETAGVEGAEVPMIDMSTVNEAMRRLREEYSLSGDDAEALVDFALLHVRLEEEAAALREEVARHGAAEGSTH